MQKCGNWFNRVLAYLIDFIIVLLFVAPLNYINFTGEKSFLWYFIVVSISICYKPLLEYYFKKTVGKHFLGLFVNNVGVTRMNLVQAYARNIFFILPSLLSIPFYYFAFNDSELAEITDFQYFATAMSSKFPLQNVLNTFTFILLILDFLYLIINKQNRALHDIIAKTVVLQK